MTLCSFRKTNCVSIHDTDPGVAVEISAGIEVAWQPLVLLVLQALWIIAFVMFGKRRVSGAEISFNLHYDGL